jgi:histidyl-tRNA synthetase
VRAFLVPTLDEHCELCRSRFERNVLRVLDCKNPRCQELNAGAPAILAFLSGANREHFEQVQGLLAALGRRVRVDPGIVRGLDYYTRTVFEIHAPALGARSALCGGGRYDHLIADLGGPDLGAVGFAVGFTSTLLYLRELGRIAPEETIFAEVPAAVFVVSAGENLEREVFLLAEALRKEGIATVYDVEARSLKAQMKLAGKGGHPFALVLGPAEVQSQSVQVKDLARGEQRSVAREHVVAYLEEQLEQLAPPGLGGPRA